MNIKHLREIIAYNKANQEVIQEKIKKYCSFASIDIDNDILNVLQIVRTSFQKKGFMVFELPIDDDEIGALCYKDDGIGYVMINSSLPKVNINFIIAHEIYHAFFCDCDSICTVGVVDNEYYENKQEYAANLFAGMLLMPENNFRRMFLKFKSESNDGTFDTIIRLMSYYQMTYMAVLIRCLELDLLDSNIVTDQQLSIDKETIRKRLTELWLDETIMNCSKKDDFLRLKKLVGENGKSYICDEYINERDLKKALNNMDKLYQQIRRK